MTAHLSEKILESLRTKTLPPGELMLLDDHLASCEACREMIGANGVAKAAAERFESALIDDRHISYEELEAFVDGRLPAGERLVIDRHVSTCEACGMELRELAEFAAGSTAKVNTYRAGGFLSALGGLFRGPVPALVSIAILLSIGAALWWILPGSGVVEPSVPTSVATVGEPPVTVPEQPISEEGPAAVDKNIEEDLAVSINDGDDVVGLTADGNFSGYASADSEYRALIGGALSKGRLKLPDLGDLKPPAGVLMGSDTDAAGSFRLHSPVGKVRLSDTVTFVWHAVPGAESYVVKVFDTNFDPIASSGELTATSWTHKFERGQTYSWQVTAVSDGKVFKAPQRPQSEARFRILDRRTAFRLSELRRSYPKSHLLLGTAYANAGLIDEAIREFEILSRNNPRNDLPKRFLRQLRNTK